MSLEPRDIDTAPAPTPAIDPRFVFDFRAYRRPRRGATLLHLARGRAAVPWSGAVAGLAGHQPLWILAAQVVDPDSSAHRAALAEALLGSDLPFVTASVAPSQFARSRLDVAGSFTYAAVSAEGSYLLTSGTTESRLWQARS